MGSICVKRKRKARPEEQGELCLNKEFADTTAGDFHAKKSYSSPSSKYSFGNWLCVGRKTKQPTEPNRLPKPSRRRTA